MRGMFLAYTKTLRNTNLLDDIIAQKAKWPDKPENRDVLYFLAQSFRARLLAELPKANREFPAACFPLRTAPRA